MTRRAAREAQIGESEPRRFLNPQDKCWYVQITQGETHVSGDPKEILTTVLGSCIAACIRDPLIGIGGMNHFLLPHGEGADRDAKRYGVNAMELLINELLKKGAARNRLEAKIFGGANVIAGLSDVGSRNATFAEQFLADEGIALVGGNVRGTLPRRIQYWPANGRARQLEMPPVDTKKLVERELAQALPPKAARGKEDDVELF
jgi:chemotaxis protein CheD